MLVSRSVRATYATLLVVLFALILLGSDWLGLWQKKTRKQHLWAHFPFFLQAASPQKILKAFHGTLTIPSLFDPLICLVQLLEQIHRQRQNNNHMTSIVKQYVSCIT